MRGSSRIKAVNAVLAALMLVLLCLHGLGNAFQLFGVGRIVPAVIGWLLFGVACAHAALGVAMTMQTLAEQARAERAYWRLNKRFWVVRASGLAIALFAICHLFIFGQFSDGAFRLNYFGGLQLVLSVLFAVSVCVHVLANLQPLMISLGIAQPKGRAADLAVVFALISVVIAFAFIVYFIRWSVV